MSSELEKIERLKKCQKVTGKSWQEIVVELESSLARELELQREICEDNHGWYDLTEEEYAKTRGWNCYDEESDTK